MSYHGPSPQTWEAGEDLSSMQYRFVVLSDDNKVRMANSGTEKPLGILQNDPASGEAAVVATEGISKLVAGASGLSRDDCVALEYIGASDNGKGIATTTAATWVAAVCIMAAGSEDDVATVKLSNFFYTDVTS